MTNAYDFCEKFGEYWTDECNKKRWTWKERYPDSYTVDDVSSFDGIVITVMAHKKDVKYSYKVGFVDYALFDHKVPTDYNMIVFHDGSWIIDDGCAELSEPDIGESLYWSGPFGNFLKLAQDTYILRKNLENEKYKQED